MSLRHPVYESLLRKCLENGSLEEGRRLHSVLVENGWFYRDSVLGNLVIQIYGSFGRVREAKAAFEALTIKNVYAWTVLLRAYAQNGHLQRARDLFEAMPQRTAVSWTAMISSCVLHQHGGEALRLFQRMILDGAMPTKTTFLSALGAAASLTLLPQGRTIHCALTQVGFAEDVTVGSALINMYGKCGSVEEARSVFDAMPERSIVSWTGMITGYAQNGHLQQAESFFVQMPACSVIVWNAMMSAYTRAGHLPEARELLDSMPDTDVTTWDIMLGAYSDKRRFDEAKCLFERMPHRCVTSWTIMLSCCGNADDAVATFQRMPLHDVVAQNAMITVLAQSGRISEARQMFNSMPQKDAATWNAMAAAFSLNGHMQESMELLQKMSEPNLFSRGVMITTYAKSGQLHRAKEVFDSMPQKEVASWNTLLTAHIIREDEEECKRAIQMFHSMGNSIQPNELTYVAVLGACQKLGSLVDARSIHAAIQRRGYESHLVLTSLVETYGKCGSLGEAMAVFDAMKVKDELAWNALASAYGHNGLAVEVIDLYHEIQLLGIRPVGLMFVNVIAACSHSGRYAEGRKAFMVMVGDYSVTPDLDHYLCMVDLLGRSGQLLKAEELVRTMPFEADYVAWTSLLSSCSVQADPELAAVAAANVLEIDHGKGATYSLLSSMVRHIKP